MHSLLCYQQFPCGISLISKYVLFKLPEAVLGNREALPGALPSTGALQGGQAHRPLCPAWPRLPDY